MRIGSRIFVVGAIPMVIAACIAVAAILLLSKANRARTGAAVAGTVYRTMLTAVMARNDYLHEAPATRSVNEKRFFDLTIQARQALDSLRTIAPTDTRILAADLTLSEYVWDMSRLVRVTLGGDQMAEAMGSRAATLIELTDQARDRQHASSAEIVASLTENDVNLRAARDIVDTAYATRLALASMQSDLLKLQTPSDTGETLQSRRMLSFDAVRLKEKASDLIALRSDKTATIGNVSAFDSGIPAKIATLGEALDAGRGTIGSDVQPLLQDVAQWAERILKIYSAQYRSLQEQSAQLMTYSVQAHDTELATQSIAIELLKLKNQSADALSRRDEDTSNAILKSSRGLSDAIASLPLPPLIQTEMIGAFDEWHDGLQTTTDGVKQQNGLIRDMDVAADKMIQAARSLDATLSANADRTARSIQAILIIGAATGVLLGGGGAYVVARSITTPLANLKSRITVMAQEQAPGGLIDDAARRDELGDIARATNIFLVEIARRERALRKSKELADATLATLRRTQAELIQAEKLASLGQLVAGVAHEINTPIGIALTTSTVVEEETRRFAASASQGGISRSALDRLIERVSEGASLLTANLTRAADLIQSFKYVAADQISGEQREFDVQTFLHRILVSLGPMLRKANREITMECPDNLTMDGHPGALGQVITNLVVNASVHAFDDTQVGHITVTASLEPDGIVRFKVADNGRGIPAAHRSKIFDPFFTTRRAKGSTGLGLHIVFNLVTSTLQGRIDFDTVPGSGTCFTVDLPRVAKQSQPTLAAPEVS